MAASKTVFSAVAAACCCGSDATIIAKLFRILSSITARRRQLNLVIGTGLVVAETSFPTYNQQ